MVAQRPARPVAEASPGDTVGRGLYVGNDGYIGLKPIENWDELKGIDDDL